MDGWMDGWTDGWMDGWTDGRTDGQTEGGREGGIERERRTETEIKTETDSKEVRQTGRQRQTNRQRQTGTNTKIHKDDIHWLYTPGPSVCVSVCLMYVFLSAAVDVRAIMSASLASRPLVIAWRVRKRAQHNDYVWLMNRISLTARTETVDR